MPGLSIKCSLFCSHGKLVRLPDSDATIRTDDHCMVRINYIIARAIVVSLSRTSFHASYFIFDFYIPPTYRNKIGGVKIGLATRD